MFFYLVKYDIVLKAKSPSITQQDPELYKELVKENTQDQV